MKIIFRLGLLAGVVALGFWLWTVCFPGPEKLIFKKIAGLAATATFNAGDSPLTRAGKAATLVGDFSADAQINFEALGQGVRSLSGRDEIREVAYAGFSSLPGLKVQFLDVTVHLGADQLTAEVRCTARVVVGDSKDYGVQEMRFQLKKTDGAWVISRAETVKTLSSSGQPPAAENYFPSGGRLMRSAT